MKTLEHEGKSIFSRYGLLIPRGKVVDNSPEGKKVAEEFGGEVMVKAQVHTGGRGKEGGIKKASTPQEALQWTKEILGRKIRGYTVNKVYIEERVNIEEEYYLAFILDRSSGLPLFIISSKGGIDIEKVAREEPERVRRLKVNPLWGIHPYQVRREALEARIPSSHLAPIVSAAMKLYEVFMGEDALLAEINPALLTSEGRLVCGDSKVELDDNAFYRHQELYNSLESYQEEDPLERRARKEGLSFVKLKGNIGVIGNGAGLVMSTLDSISREGGSPANFLDIGGGASADKMEAAIDIVLANPRVNSLFINIFGGITRCDEAARGIIAAIKNLSPQFMPVVRLGGTNEEEGWRILEDSGVEIKVCKSMKEAVIKAIEYKKEA